MLEVSWCGGNQCFHMLPGNGSDVWVLWELNKKEKSSGFLNAGSVAGHQLGCVPGVLPCIP